LTDEVMRIRSVKSSINIFRRAAAKASVEGFGTFNATGLKFLAAGSRMAPAPWSTSSRNESVVSRRT